MKQFVTVAICSGFLSANCGGGPSSGAQPSSGVEAAADPTADTASNPVGDNGEIDDGSPASAKAASSTAEPAASSTPTSTSGLAAASAPAANKEEVKEAVEARITDKHIVISGKILFETGNAKLKKVSYEVLDEVVFALEKHPEIIKLQVVGHTDSDGDAKANKSLSKRRAAAVMQYLIKNGIEKDRLSAIGEGEDVPIADNETEEGKDKNRRVEFEIVERAKVVAVTHSAGTMAPGKVDSRKATDDETEELIKKEGLDKKFRK